MCVPLTFTFTYTNLKTFHLPRREVEIEKQFSIIARLPRLVCRDVIHLAWICKMTSECNKYAFLTLSEVVIQPTFKL
jgi:hypothetical protein